MEERFIPVMRIGRKKVKGEPFFLFDDIKDSDLTKMDVFRTEEGIFACVRVYHPRDKWRILSLFEMDGILRAVGPRLIQPLTDDVLYWYKFRSEKVFKKFKDRALKNRVFIVEMHRYKKFLYNRWYSDSNK